MRTGSIPPSLDARQLMSPGSGSIGGVILAILLSGCGEQLSSDSTQSRAAASREIAIPINGSAGPGRSPVETPVSVFESAEQVKADDWFEDITSVSGIRFTYRNGQEGGHFSILESLGGGAAVFDFDRDDKVDVFLTGGGTIDGSSKISGLPSSLFRNVGPLQFQDVSINAGIASPGDYSHGCFVADFDCDGFADAFVTAYGRCRLFQNKGDGSFEEISAVSDLNQSGWWTAAAWGDVDRDGLPDVFVAGYLEWSPETDQRCWNGMKQREVCGPNRFSAANDQLYRNRGDGSFEEITSQVGLKCGGNGLGVVAADINRDGYLDYYVANDETDNFFYLGQADGTLREVAHAAGVAVNQCKRTVNPILRSSLN